MHVPGTIHALNETAVRAHLLLLDRLADRSGEERGDVPGWVMVTVMTAMLVVALGALAREELSALLSDALQSVTG